MSLVWAWTNFNTRHLMDSLAILESTLLIRVVFGKQG